MFDMMQHNLLAKSEARKELLRKQIGKYFVAEAREDGTRLFIRELSDFSDVVTKEGWWNIFTISKYPVTKGIYVCRLDEVTSDKDNFIMFIVSPSRNLGEINLNSVAWDYLFKSNEFISEFVVKHKDFINVDALIEKFGDLLNKRKEDYIKIPSLRPFYPGDSQFFASTLLLEFLSGNITLEEIEEPLLLPTEIEAVIDDIFCNISKYKKENPKMIAQMCNNNICLLHRDVENYIYRKVDEYDSLLAENKVAGKATTILEKINDIFDYREIEKENGAES